MVEKKVSRINPLFGTTGFTLIELVGVLVLIGVLAAVVLPRFIAIGSEARVATLENVAGAMRATVSLVQAKARLAGLQIRQTNPGAGQTAYIIETELGRSELDYRNLCPESSAELADALDMADYMVVHLSGDMTIATDNRYTRIGFELSNNTISGCYVRYDSFGDPECTVEVVSADC